MGSLEESQVWEIVGGRSSGEESGGRIETQGTQAAERRVMWRMAEGEGDEEEHTDGEKG